MATPSEKDVKSWVDASRYDLETAKALLKSRRFLYVLFMCQQAIEKMGNWPRRFCTRGKEVVGTPIPVLSSESLSTRNPGLGEESKRVDGGISIEANGGPMAKAKKTGNPDEVIRRAIEYLLQKIRIDQAVLFGSHATGRADEWSDVDLAVISPDFARMSHKKLMDLLVEVALTVDSSVEIRPYTPTDFKEARPTNFLGHILAKGRVVYKDHAFLL